MAITDKDIELALATTCHAVVEYHGIERGRSLIFQALYRGGKARLEGRKLEHVIDLDLLQRIAWAAVHAGEGAFYMERLGNPLLRVNIDAKGKGHIFVQDLADTVTRLGVLKRHDLPRAMREQQP